jgi:hypothetical protein
MTRKLFGGGLLAILMGVFFLTGSGRQPAQGQPAAVAPPPAAGRYQISSFVIDGRTPGAYVLDIQTGEVVQVIGRDEPVRVGSADKPQPPK